MFLSRNRRQAMYCTAIWCVQLFLIVLAIYLLLRERAHYMLALQAALLATVLFRGPVIWQRFEGALSRNRRSSKRASPEVMAERHRIARDLHDGIGLQLVAAMAMLDARNPKELRILQELELCMLGLRMAVDAMAMSNEPLIVRLAGLRHRIEPLLECRGVRLEWNVQSPDDVSLPEGPKASEIIFIMQEALGNVVHHAQATQVQVTMMHEPNRGVWCFEVCDNGVGLPAGLDAVDSGHGQGVKAMRHRAKQAGLHLALETPEGGGTRVRLEARGYWQSDAREMFFS